MSIHSPKHRFCAEIHFDTPIEGVGSVIRYTSDTLEGAKFLAIVGAQRKSATVVILHNRLTFPEFEWEQVDKYRLY